MNIPCSYFYSKNKTSLVASCVCFVCKLPFMFSFDKHSSIRVGSGNCLFNHPSTRGALIIVIVIVVDRLFPQLLTLGIYLLPELLSVHLGSLGYLLFLVFLLICTGFYVSPINKHSSWVYHAVVKSFIQDVLKNLHG